MAMSEGREEAEAIAFYIAVAFGATGIIAFGCLLASIWLESEKLFASGLLFGGASVLLFLASFVLMALFWLEDYEIEVYESAEGCNDLD